MPIRADLTRLPIPPNYMRAAEHKQVREMTRPMGRPAGDHRSAERIIEQSPVLRHLLDNRDNYHVLDELMMQVGDWTEANPDPKSRADAAYDLDKILRFIDNVDDRTLSCSRNRNGYIDGFCANGYGTAHNSEARLLQAFSYEGYEILRYLPT